MIDYTMPQGKEPLQTPGIAGERRNDRRYALHLDLKWKLVRRRRMLDAGTGHTLDLSSGGILLDAGRHLPVGLNLELSVSWPVLLHNIAPMQLAISGRIVRTDGRLVAVQMVQHEFRTAGIAIERRDLPHGTSHNPTNLLNSIFSVNRTGKSM